MRAVRAASAALVLALAGCVTPPAPPTAPPHVVFTPIAYDAIPAWRDDRLVEAWPAFRIGCKALVARARTQAAWQAPCSAADAVDANDGQAVRNFFEANFTPYRVGSSDGSDTGLVTGYYEPLLLGSRAPAPEYPVPLYAPPDDLLAVELAELYPERRG